MSTPGQSGQIWSLFRHLLATTLVKLKQSLNTTQTQMLQPYMIIVRFHFLFLSYIITIWYYSEPFYGLKVPIQYYYITIK